MKLFIVREGRDDPGVAYPKFQAAAKAAAALPYAEIVRVDMPQRGARLRCALFNRELPDNAAVVAVVQGGKLLALNEGETDA